jgi:capsid protein
LKRIRTGTLTLSEAIAQNGYDPEKQLQEIKRMNDLLDELQIILDCDPRKVNDKGVEQQGVGGETAPEPSAKQPTTVKHSARQWDSPTRSYTS